MTKHEIEYEIRDALTKITLQDVSAIPIDADLSQAIGLDSLGRLELIAELEEVYDTFLDDVEVGETNTIADLIEVALHHIVPDIKETA